MPVYVIISPVRNLWATYGMVTMWSIVIIAIDMLLQLFALFRGLRAPIFFPYLPLKKKNKKLQAYYSRIFACSFCLILFCHAYKFHEVAAHLIVVSSACMVFSMNLLLAYFWAPTTWAPPTFCLFYVHVCVFAPILFGHGNG